MNEFINEDIGFPILSKMKGEFIVINTLKEFTICKRSVISTLRDREEYVLDSYGNYYKTVDIEYLRDVNIFGGFSLKFAGFGACRVKKKLKKISTPFVEDLRRLANEFLNFYKEGYAGSEEDFDTMQRKIDSAETSQQILHLILVEMA